MFITLDQRLIAGLHLKGGPVAGGIGVREGRQTCFGTHGSINADTSIRTERADNHSIQINMETEAQRSILV